jgi:hypothetical protein
MSDEPSGQADERVKIDLEPEDALKALLKVDPDAPPAKRNEDEPVEESEPLKDQGDPLNPYGENWSDHS